MRQRGQYHCLRPAGLAGREQFERFPELCLRVRRLAAVAERLRAPLKQQGQPHRVEIRRQVVQGGVEQGSRSAHFPSPVGGLGREPEHLDQVDAGAIGGVWHSRPDFERPA